MNCPNCKSQNVSKVKWTWWGGILGALITNQHKCNACGLKFDPKDFQHTNQAPTSSNITQNIKIPDTCPHCKNSNTKRIRLCEWCGNQIC
jgi:predicted Zn-ribbon and HTH transcriptional regulator